MEYLHSPVLREGGEEEQHGESIVNVPQGIREGGISGKTGKATWEGERSQWKNG